MQQSNSKKASGLSSAGPFLRYGNCLPGSTEWRGSVLFLTHSDQNLSPAKLQTDPISSGVGGINISASTNGVQSSSEAPTLTFEEGAEGATPQPPILLDNISGWSFWRFDISLQLGPAQRPVRYTVAPSNGSSKSATFWLPAMGQPFHWAYTSCNGIDESVPEDHFARKDPTYLWRDLLKVHGAFPMHALVGGGDQVYSDDVWKESAALKAWGDIESTEEKLAVQWTADHQSQATAFYLRNYIDSFTLPHVSEAYASIPGVNVWDDHDIWDGYGSYDADMQSCPVFKGLFEVARRFYLLFQQHTTQQHAQTSGDFPALDDGYHSMRFMGPQVAVLCVDMRTKRTKKEILPQSTYALMRSMSLSLPEGIEHLVVLSGVPVIFPNIPLSEEILTGIKSFVKCSTCVRDIAKTSGVITRFGQPELMDDLLDGWAAKIHKDEKMQFIHLLQEIALEKKVRVTILSGDAHVGGVGRLYTRKHPKLDPRDDPLFMAQIISSAIMNGPPPLNAVKVLMRTNFAQNLDDRTRQKLCRAFWPYHPRTDKLLARRNWCDVALIAPPYSLPGNPLDPDFGGLHFALRVEDSDKKKGYAEEVYEIVSPRAPRAVVVVGSSKAAA